MSDNELELNERLYESRLSHALVYGESGKVTQSLGLLYEAYLPEAAIGSICRIYPRVTHGEETFIEAEVVGFRDKKVLLMPFSELGGINTDSLVVLKERSPLVMVTDSLLGRVLDAHGNPIDGKGPIIQKKVPVFYRSLYQRPSHPLERNVIVQPLDLGVRAMNGLLTTGKGQRVGIMAGSGVGKSVLLGMMARNTSADVNVIGLIGERGREVREFVERDLGPEGLARSVVVVATSDQSPLLRMRGAFLATTIAEYFRDAGSDVLLMMDSVTRFCMAQREIGLSMGEPPTSKGYTPSVFSTLPRLLERAGTTSGKGSITGLYTVLVEADDMDDPIADSVRSILDGHVILSRKIASKNQFPAIDVLNSASRVMRSVTSEEHQKWAGQIREWMAVYAQAEDLINIGAYVRGANPKIDQAIAVHDRIEVFLRQKVDEKGSFQDSLDLMNVICRYAEAQSQVAAAMAGQNIQSRK